VDLVVPVRGAAAVLARLLASLAGRPAGHPFRLVLVLDGPPTADVEAVLGTELERFPGAALLRLPVSRGFAAAINLGSRASTADLVWLNSDVEVPAGWLGRLRRAARSGADVATATPLTNHGTIASVPRWLEENALPAGHDLASFAHLVERVSAGSYPTVPTGVGFCLYVRREALAAVGSLDEVGFPQGYGEEVDWCLRAAALGYRHVLDDTSFVFHEGGASFGGAKHLLESNAERLLERRHPDWRRSLGAFLAADPVRPVRDRIQAALAPAPRRVPVPPVARVLHVAHGWPPWSMGGTESYAARLARWQAGSRTVAVLARYAPVTRPRGSALELEDRGVRVRMLANRFDQRDPLSRGALYDRRWEVELDRLIAETRAELLHVHHLAGHALALTRVARRRRLPLVWQLQDWWLLCARANLVDRDARFCSGPAAAKCARCLPLTRIFPAGGWSRLLHYCRRRLAHRALGSAAAVIAGSETVVTSHRQAGMLPPTAPVHVLDYGVDLPAAGAPAHATAAEPIRLGFVGTPLPHKGLELLLDALCRLPRGQFLLRLWSPPSAELGRALAHAGAGVEVEVLDPFEDADRARALASVDLLVAPSIGLESYGLAVAEAHAAGTPALVADRGALPERVARGGGAIFPAGDVDALVAALRGIAADPEVLDRWRRAIPPIRSFSDHAEEVDAIYADALEAGARR